MKRTIALASAVALALGLAACSGDDSKAKPSYEDSGSSVPSAMDGDYVATPMPEADPVSVDTHADLFAIYEDEDAEQPAPQTLMKVKASEDGPKSLQAALDLLDVKGAKFVRVTIDNRNSDDDLEVTDGMVTDKAGKTYELAPLSERISAAQYDADAESHEYEVFSDADDSLQDATPAGAIGTQWFIADKGLPDKASRFTLDIGGFETKTPVSEVAKAEGSNAFDPGALDFTDPNEK